MENYNIPIQMSHYGLDPLEIKVSFIPPDKKLWQAPEGKRNMKCVVKGDICKGQLQTVTACRNEDGSCYNCIFFILLSMSVCMYIRVNVYVYTYMYVYISLFSSLSYPLTINFT